MYKKKKKYSKEKGFLVIKFKCFFWIYFFNIKIIYLEEMKLKLKLSLFFLLYRGKKVNKV